MTNSKISPELTMALEIPEAARAKSLNLNVGYSELFEEWELIVRYTGSLSQIQEDLNLSIEELLGGYAIVRIPQYLIGALSDYPEIDYIEKPKSLLLEEMEGIAASCVNPVRQAPYRLNGTGVIVACLDSGIDIYHPDFQNTDGTTRILALWDQTIPGNPPEGFHTGSIYTADTINEALALGKDRGGGTLVPSFDATGHGTAICGILAGNGRASEDNIIGVAPDSDILVVKLGNPDNRGFPRTTQLMSAIDYALRYAISVRKPIAINISFGNNYGNHNGDSILEQYMDTVANIYQNVIVTGTGNDGVSARHASGTLSRNQTETIELYAADYLTSFNLQIWKYYLDDFTIQIETPTGIRLGPFSPYSRVQNYNLPEDLLSVYYSEPTPYNAQQEIYISWIPVNDYVTSGIWRIYLYPGRIVSGQYDMWLPVAGSTSSEVSFVRPALYNTLVIPSTARNVISVAAYNSINQTYANFSGRGILYDSQTRLTDYKPDLAAPGVHINTCAIGGGYRSVSGTSFAAPFVTGAAALLMQYGIVNGNDPYLYGEKIRASLIRGAKRLPFQQQTPSPLVGWGALCVADSLA